MFVLLDQSDQQQPVISGKSDQMQLSVSLKLLLTLCFCLFLHAGAGNTARKAAPWP